MTNIGQLIRHWWWARCRATDLDILWPVCKQQAASLDQAKMAFMAHAVRDRAWVNFYQDRLWEIINDFT